jgi:hypothetical protein
MLGMPAAVIDEVRALEWLTTNGLEPPAELATIAQQCRLGQRDAASG